MTIKHLERFYLVNFKDKNRLPFSIICWKIISCTLLSMHKFSTSNLSKLHVSTNVLAWNHLNELMCMSIARRRYVGAFW